MTYYNYISRRDVMKSKHLTIKQKAELLNKSITWVKNWIKQNKK